MTKYAHLSGRVKFSVEIQFEKNYQQTILQSSKMSAMKIATSTLSANPNDPRLLFETLKEKYPDILPSAEEMLKEKLKESEERLKELGENLKESRPGSRPGNRQLL